MRLLLIEDDQKGARLLAKGLREEGWVVDLAATGETGEELATANAYDAIVLDWMLPDKDGLRICRDLRAVTVQRESGRGVVTVDAIDPAGGFINFLDTQLGVVTPDKRQTVVELEQVAPGRYRGTFPARRVGVGREARRAALTAAETIQAKLALGDLSLLDPPTPVPIPPPVPVFEHAARQWLAMHSQLGPLRASTQALYTRALRTYVYPRFGVKPITEVNPHGTCGTSSSTSWRGDAAGASCGTSSRPSASYSTS